MYLYTVEEVCRLQEKVRLKKTMDGESHSNEGNISISQRESTSTVNTQSPPREAVHGDTMENEGKQVKQFGHPLDVINESVLHCSVTNRYAENGSPVVPENDAHSASPEPSNN